MCRYNMSGCGDDETAQVAHGAVVGRLWSVMNLEFSQTCQSIRTEQHCSNWSWALWARCPTIWDLNDWTLSTAMNELASCWPKNMYALQAANMKKRFAENYKIEDKLRFQLSYIILLNSHFPSVLHVEFQPVSLISLVQFQPDQSASRRSCERRHWCLPGQVGYSLIMVAKEVNKAIQSMSTMLPNIEELKLVKQACFKTFYCW